MDVLAITTSSGALMRYGVKFHNAVMPLAMARSATSWARSTGTVRMAIETPCSRCYASS